MTNAKKEPVFDIPPSSRKAMHEGARLCWKDADNKKALGNAFKEVIALLHPIVNNEIDDGYIAQFMLQENLYGEPLSWHEFTVLGCAIYQEIRSNGGAFDYANVVELTHRFQGKPMNTTMIYKSVVALEQKGLIAPIGKEKSQNGRVSDHFVVTRSGRGAFRLSTANALHMQASRDQAAA